MKKAAIYYFAVLMLLHVFIGWILMHAYEFVWQLYPAWAMFGDMNLPPLTEFMLPLFAWPYVIAVLAAAGVIASLTIEDRRRLLPHAAFILQCASCILLLANAIAYLAPFSHSDFVRGLLER